MSRPAASFSRDRASAASDDQPPVCAEPTIGNSVTRDGKIQTTVFSVRSSALTVDCWPDCQSSASLDYPKPHRDAELVPDRLSIF